MKVMKLLTGLFAISFVYGFAQAPAPEKLEQITDLLAHQDFAEMSEIEGLVRTRGLDFDLEGQQLAKILEAATKGNRNPDEVSALILTCLKACHSCRAQALAPLTIEEIKSLQAWGFAVGDISHEAQVRGVRDLEISQAGADQLRAAGIREEVIAFLVPDDKVQTPLIEGYKTLNLKRADEYDLAAPEGFLKVTTSLPPNSQSEFFFKHNALFIKIIKGMPPEDLGAYFNKPTPRNTDTNLIDLTSGVEDYEGKSGILGIGKKKEFPIEVSKVKADGDGRTAFRILATNKEPNRYQRFSFYIRWHLLTEPKPASQPPKG